LIDIKRDSRTSRIFFLRRLRNERMRPTSSRRRPDPCYVFVMASARPGKDSSHGASAFFGMRHLASVRESHLHRRSKDIHAAAEAQITIHRWFGAQSKRPCAIPFATHPAGKTGESAAR
jgi:hypothetical protein